MLYFQGHQKKHLWIDFYLTVIVQKIINHLMINLFYYLLEIIGGLILK